MPPMQTAASHTARDPITLFVLAPIFLISFIIAIVMAFHAQGTGPILLHIWLVVLAAALFLLNFKTRAYSAKVQDRVIRLEERLRIGQLLAPAEAAAAIDTLSIPQLVALRFASDAELPTLVRATLAENLDQKAIKSRIVSWRPDTARI